MLDVLFYKFSIENGRTIDFYHQCKSVIIKLILEIIFKMFISYLTYVKYFTLLQHVTLLNRKNKHVFSQNNPFFVLKSAYLNHNAFFNLFQKN